MLRAEVIGFSGMGKDRGHRNERRRRARFAAESALLLVFVTALAAALSEFGILQQIERGIDDVALAYFSDDAAQPHSRVAVIEIDDETIARHPPRSPINRTFLADLLELVDGGGTTAIGVDVLLLEAGNETSDRELAATLKAMRSPVVLTTVMRDGRVRSLAPIFAETGARVALANLPADRADGTLRRYRTAFRDAAGELHPILAAALARIAGARVPTGTRDQPIDWYGRPGWQDRLDADRGEPAGPPPIARFSALMLLEKPFLAGLLEGKVVLIGATFEGSGDLHRTPFARLRSRDGALPGVAAHAQIVAQLIDGRRRVLPGPELELLAVVLAVAAGALLALARVPAYVPIICALLLPVSWVTIVFLVRQQTEVMLPALPPVLGLGFALGGFALLRARRFDRAQRIAAKALQSYLPRALARQVMIDPTMLRLGGEPRTLSILFSDIARFTAYAERHQPQEVVAVLNEYLDAMAEIVLAHQGTLDKFIGDAVMAFFGAPGDLPDHAARAIACALEMDRFGHRFAERHGLETRVGVHTGPVIVGNTGGERRFDYTVIGDAVNTASRLESANRHLGLSPQSATSVCISEDTVRHALAATEGEGEGEGEDGRGAGRWRLRRAGRIKVKGRERPLGVYTTVPDWFEADDLKAYERALDELERGAYETARAAFEALADDHLSAFQARRCVDRVGPYLRLEEK